MGGSIAVDLGAVLVVGGAMSRWLLFGPALGLDALALLAGGLLGLPLGPGLGFPRLPMTAVLRLLGAAFGFPAGLVGLAGCLLRGQALCWARSCR